jgi:predicted RNase H-like nuclease (RuvC/YqgF family)
MMDDKRLDEILRFAHQFPTDEKIILGKEVKRLRTERDSLKDALETQAPDFKMKGMYVARGQEIEALRSSLEKVTRELEVLKGEHHRLKMACGRALIEQSGEILRGHGFEEYCCRIAARGSE